MDNFQDNGMSYNSYDNMRYCKFCGQKVFDDAVYAFIVEDE